MDDLDEAYAGSPDIQGGPEPAVFAGVAAASDRPGEDVVAVLREAVERVALGTVGIDLTWTTVALTPADVLSAQTEGVSRPGLDWDFVMRRHADGLTSVTLVAEATALLPYPWHPKREVVIVRAVRPEGRCRGLTVAVSVHRWALYGGGADLARSVGVAADWLLRAAERLTAETGYLTVDQVKADHDQSPWERVTGIPPALRRVETHLWGYGWGTLLSPVHLEQIGGMPALTASRLGTAHPLQGGRVWFTLAREPAEVTHDDIAALRRVLLPALPKARRSLEDFRRELEEYGAAEPDYLV